jgi:beta-glucosidase
MVTASFHFPKGFSWGTATAAYQVEGNNTNSHWWEWEQQPGNILHDHKSGLACDWWGGRWREDLDRAAESHQNAHRMSVEWSRIQPSPTHWDESAIDHYREIMRGMAERGLTPMVTLHHFSDPIWLSELGSWENAAMIEYFEKFVGKVVEALKEYVSLWVTINEPNVLLAWAYVLGEFPPGKKDFRGSMQVATNIIRAHAAAYHLIHKIQPQACVGIATNYRGFIPAKPWYPPDRWAANLQNRLFNDLFPKALSDGVLRFPVTVKRIAQAKNTQDFVGINYYTRDRVAFNLLSATEMFGKRFYPKDADLSDNGFIANEPEGIFSSIKWALQFKKPIIITENGVEDSDDHLRPRYLLQHLHQLWHGVNFNWPVKGYFHWTLVDNFEWERGWTQRFGLWELDNETQARRKRPSADLFSEICRDNCITSDMVSRYAPEIFQILFPE